MITDFDFLVGEWKVLNTRLSQWLCDNRQWIEFDSHHVEKRLQSGTGNFAWHQYVLSNTLCERSILRLYEQASDFWSINRLDAMTGLLMAPLTGTFWKNKGSFLSKGQFAGKEVLVWVEWTRICKTYACWEQAMSSNDGRTWENNWVMEFYRE